MYDTIIKDTRSGVKILVDPDPRSGLNISGSATLHKSILVYTVGDVPSIQAHCEQYRYCIGIRNAYFFREVHAQFLTKYA
jgi:hypothetical protein